MSKLAVDDQALSLKLSSVMGDIGVTEKNILKRRRSFMLMEALDTITRRVIGKIITTYNLGSQSEGSTTLDLDSDIDTLFGYHDLNIIRHWNEAKHGAQNVLMVQDEKTAPGHCFLQFKSPKVVFKLLMRSLGKRHFIKAGRCDWLLKNTCFDEDDNVKVTYRGKSGPAHTLPGDSVYHDEDNVIAWHCEYWPKEARHWLKKGGWPTENIKRECEATGCIIVPVCSKDSLYEELEWRISTCLAERRLMFSLNVTQMRCYVLMKMINETLLKLEFPDIKISSYVCKTVLFHCISKTQCTESQSTVWVENNLLECLEICLLYLESCISRQTCEHFFIPANNLLKGKVPVAHVQKLVTYIHSITLDKWSFLMKISLDCLNVRLSAKIGLIKDHMILEHIPSTTTVSSIISAKLLDHIAVQLEICHKYHLKVIYCSDLQIEVAGKILQNLPFMAKSNFDRLACELITPLFSSSLASAITSKNIETNNSIPSYASYLFSNGLRSDVSSGKLKYGCALYCNRDMKTTRYLLEKTEHEYDKTTVQTVCPCNEHNMGYQLKGFRDRANKGNEDLIKDIISFCVKFLPSEINCVPHELKYELFRSTSEDKPYINDHGDYWMYWAVVDSLPFLYFLQYKVYGRLQMTEKQKTALSNFEETIRTEEDLGHKETALNLLGQCMEQENRFNDALGMYVQSLNVRRRNNAAKIHICRLLNARLDV